jgi:Flagellar protein FliT
MDAGDRIGLLRQILELSQDILRLVDVGDWVRGLELDGRRRELIEECFSQHGGFADPQEAADLLRAILAVDERVLARAQSAGPELSAAVSRLRQGRAAIAAYRRQGAWGH